MKGKTCSGKDIPRILYLGESFCFQPPFLYLLFWGISSGILFCFSLFDRLIISGLSIKSWGRHINRLTGNADILQLAFLTESANMNHGCGTYHPRDALKVGTLHNLMIAEILF